MSPLSFRLRGWPLFAIAGSLAAAGSLLAFRSPSEQAQAASSLSSMASPATRAALDRARAEAQAAPDEVKPYQQLAVAWMQIQRETGDPSLYAEAARALDAARRRAPGDYETAKLSAWVLAGQHRFDEALVVARDCVRRNPRDYWNYGVIGDALTETGDYPGAVAAIQKMVNLRPGPTSYTRAAHLRRLHGDPEGAIALLRMALESTGPGQPEVTAWQQTQIGGISFLSGELETADAAYTAALHELPNYHLALAGRAQLLAARGDLRGAMEHYRKALRHTERPDWMAALGDLQRAAGEPGEAEAQYRRVEAQLTRHMGDPAADATHQLAQFLADRGREPARALVLAQEEAAAATDIRAYDTLSIALYHAGKYPEAWEASQKARRLQTREPKLLYHAGLIAIRLPRRRSEGMRLLHEALELNPAWDPLDAPAARRMLDEAMPQSSG